MGPSSGYIVIVGRVRSFSSHHGQEENTDWNERRNPDSAEPLLFVILSADRTEYERAGLTWQMLEAEGWKNEWHARGGSTKYVHVDELEKIEGPPLEGPF